ncbi:DUF4402 domain-containing protein [Chitinophaga qingshengii]|uniref:DUF4402 domain-containing protein n=1 Tax=Chitinophaga qingshengii TaxID=1569794 RepID=A0ABR7TI36_9BACT|nr:DUF4402 domain-containing protein [Chitinophaga qingshengii]MBC9929173.1 DUF4402 domain-containing protein [Chitinophaga qingshengii]
MKKVLSLIVIASAIFAGKAVAQTSATATANAFATVITPITLTKTLDLNFGILAASATPGTLKITPAGVRSTTGGVSTLPTTGTVTPALFSVAGEDGYSYAITLPLIPVVLNNTTHVGAFMLATNFASSPSVITGGLLTGGTQALNVGATLYVGANQTPGQYNSLLPFPVTVNYN